MPYNRRKHRDGPADCKLRGQANPADDRFPAFRGVRQVRPEKGGIVAKKKTPANTDLEFAYRTAKQCCDLVQMVFVCASETYTPFPGMTALEAAGGELKRLEKAVADGQQIPLDVKAELQGIRGKVVLPKCRVQGVSAHDAAVKLGYSLLACASAMACKIRPADPAVRSLEATGDYSRLAAGAFSVVKSWDYEEVRDLDTQIKAEYLEAYRNRTPKRKGKRKDGGKADAAPDSPNAEDQEDESGSPKSAKIKLPSEKAMKAWRLRALQGINDQTELAIAMTKEGVPATQGQVSKWLKEAEEYLEAGGVFPKLESLNQKPDTVDPKVIDMGARQDGLTPRQRQRRRPDSDE